MDSTTYEIPSPVSNRPLVLVAMLAAAGVALGGLALAVGQWPVWIPAVLCLLAALVVYLQLVRLRGLARVRATLGDVGLELTQPGQPARFLRWDDVIGVRDDGSVLEFHLPPTADAPRGLALASTGDDWADRARFTADLTARLDASRGYTNRVCEFDALPSGGCAGGLGCAGQESCQGHALAGQH